MQTLEAKIRELLQNHGVSFKQNSKSYIMTCPRCSKAHKLYLRRADGRFVCWYCREIDGYQGKPEFALADLTGLRLKEVRKFLYGEDEQHSSVYLDLGIREFADEDDDDFIDLKPALTSIVWPFEFLTLDDPAAIKGAQYLERRGVPREIAQEYDIRYWPSECRVVFPVTSRGNLLGYQARLVERDQPYWDARARKTVTPLKILTNKELKRDQTLMFADRIHGDCAILCEGPMDALHCHLADGGAVAAMGKAVAHTQLALLRNSGAGRVYLGLDPDAYLELDRLRKEMADITLYDFRAPPPYKDLGEMPMAEVKELFDRAPVLNPTQIVISLKNHFGAN